jgi:hypothetical protein
MFDRPIRRRATAPQRLAFGNMPVPGTKVGLAVSIGLVVVAFIGIPLARLFILGAIGVGALIAWFLWWQRSRD